MKLIKVLAPLIAVAIATAVAASPAAATDIHFMHANGEPLGSGSTTLHFTGTGGFDTPNGGVACEEVTAVAIFTTHDAHITAFNGTKGCHTFGLLHEFCELTSPTAPQSTNGGVALSSTNAWTMTPLNVETFEVGGITIDNPMKPGCLFGSNVSLSGTAVLRSTTSGSIGELAVGGEFEVETWGEEATITGTLRPTAGEEIKIVDE